MRRRRPARVGLGTRLLLFASVLLVLPWLGYRYVEELSRFLLQGQEQALLMQARALATVLHERDDLFDPDAATPATLDERTALYGYPLPAAPQVDGYLSDWEPLLGRATRFGAESLVGASDDYRPQSTGMRVLLGSHGSYLYVALRVDDDRVVYRHPRYRRLDNSDHVRLTLVDPDGDVRQLVVIGEGPGTLSVYQVERNWKYAATGQPVTAVRAALQPRIDGYDMELRLPLAILGTERRLRLAVADVDDAERRSVVAVVATLPRDWSQAFNRVIVRSVDLERILNGLGHIEANVWVVDQRRRVRAAIETPNAEDDVAIPVMRIDADVVAGALAGQAGVRRLGGGDGDRLVAAHPIRAASGVLGAVVLEDRSSALLALERKTLLQISLATAATVLVIVLGLLLFASRLAWRIHRLAREADAAIDDDGRIIYTELRTARAARDELGQLSAGISAMLSRLAQYTRFLESIPRTVRHEINNPLNSISTSLQNLAEDLPSVQRNPFMAGATRGVARLGRITDSLTEAASLEQALRGGEWVRFDVAALLNDYVAGCRANHPTIEFIHHGAPQAVSMRGIPLRIEQLLDKLVDNACDFAQAGTPVVVTLAAEPDSVRIRICNSGPLLPTAILASGFDTMATQRSTSNGAAHLGIGLYVAHTIARHHGGSLQAANRTDPDGAEFTVVLPRS